ncbi:hypothetical protein ACFL6M_03545 [Candidatus Eisenbacteria bacterium]|uniref:Integrase catalytic domain-containing protein n=1 Tax=Eiseniibacteriota bacterium TaxID=2212470 RepID=A0ABV6YK04_UNCEI
MCMLLSALLILARAAPMPRATRHRDWLHRKGFKAIWRRKSRPGKIGRPRIPRKHIGYIKRICYMASRTPRGDQTWRTFVRNHAGELWACDFLTQYTAFFVTAYVFIIMQIDTRRIVHVNVTTNPMLPWVEQQIREATGADNTPRFLVHDNDGIFGQYGRRATVEHGDSVRSYRCHLDRWLGEVMGVEGVPILYGAPNASPQVERFYAELCIGGSIERCGRRLSTISSS